MAEDNVESHTLALLREIRAEINAKFDTVNGKLDQLQADVKQLQGEVQELQVGQAALSADVKGVKKGVEEVKETNSLMEGRLVHIEKQLGFVKA